MAIACLTHNGLLIIQHSKSSWDYCHRNCRYHKVQTHQLKYLQSWRGDKTMVCTIYFHILICNSVCTV